MSAGVAGRRAATRRADAQPAGLDSAARQGADNGACSPGGVRCPVSCAAPAPPRGDGEQGSGRAGSGGARSECARHDACHAGRPTGGEWPCRGRARRRRDDRFVSGGGPFGARLGRCAIRHGGGHRGDAAAYPMSPRAGFQRLGNQGRGHPFTSDGYVDYRHFMGHNERSVARTELPFPPSWRRCSSGR